MRDSVIIPADAQAVWPLVADPAEHARWNEKVVSIGRDRSGPVVRGERFEMIYRMKGRDSTTRVEVTECRPPHSVVFRHRTEWRGREQITEERYNIEPVAEGVKLTQHIDLSRAVPAWALVIIWLINRLGTTQGTSNLQRLRSLVEPKSAIAAD
jgi:uncharacterized protein YndB with AHSA1/START domain